MKLFRTGNIEVVKNCQARFQFCLPSVIWAERAKKFEANYVTFEIVLTHYGHCVDYCSSAHVISCFLRCNCFFSHDYSLIKYV